MKIRTYSRQKPNGTAIYLDYRFKGGRYRPLLGYDLTDDEKEQRTLEMVDRIRRKVQERNIPKETCPTLSEFAAIYYKTLRTSKRIDLQRPKGIVTKHLAPHFTMPLDHITPEVCLDYVELRQLHLHGSLKKRTTDGTIRRELGVLRRILQLAVIHRHIPLNPALAVQLPEGTKRQRTATMDELKALREAANLDMWRAIAVALNTGLRLGKLLEIQPSWIERAPDGRWLKIPSPASRLKGTPKQIPLNAIAAWALTNGVLRLHAPVFCRWKVRSFKKAWSDVCRRAKIADLHFHDLRHTFSTVLQEE
jgi:integrase